MKHAMKLLAVLMILCLCCACAEEAAMNEIWGHLQQEAAQDGVDLSALLQSEYEAYLQGKSASAGEEAQPSAFRTQLQQLLPGLVAAHQRYAAAETGAEIIAAAQEFNQLHDQCLQLAGEDAANRSLMADQLRMNIGRANRIREYIYLAKAALADGEIGPDYTELAFFFDPETGDSKFACSRFDEAYQRDLLILLQDGAVYVPDLSGIRAMNPSTYSVIAVTPNSVVLEVIANAEWMKYEFPLDDPASVGVQIPFEQPLPEYSVWQLFSSELTEFNAIETTEARFEYPDY